jgi:hypothetical protein
MIAVMLHEMNGVCGSHHNNAGGFEDHCDDWAQKQCATLHL